MFEPLYVAATGMNAYEKEMMNITNNLANAKTIAFKRGKVELESLFYIQKTFQQELTEAVGRQAQMLPPAGVQYGTGVRVAATPTDFSQGTIEITKSPLDIAIQGDGFLQFRMPDGTLAYGRAGNLHIDSEGNLVDPNGHYLDPSITFPVGTTDVLIKNDGRIFVSIDYETEQTEIGQISLAKFNNPEGLKALGQNLYAQTAASGDPLVGLPAAEGFGRITQFAQESSNVDVISEMMRMIMVQRVFDTVSKAVQSYEGMLASVERMKQ